LVVKGLHRARSKAVRDWMAKAPEGAFVKVKYIRLYNIVGVHLAVTLKEPVELLSNEYENVDSLSADRMPAVYIRRDALPENVVQRLKKLSEEISEIRKKEYALKKKTCEALASVTTDRKLVELYPSLAPYVQKVCAKDGVEAGRMLAVTNEEICSLMSPPCNKRK